MSPPRLPPELLDHVVDFLRHSHNSLKNCCLVSKSWIPRARKHIFAHAVFETATDVQSWKNAFPDPSTSPGHYAKSLVIRCPQDITTADTEAGGWMRTSFSRVSHLEVDTYSADSDEPRVSLDPLHGFLPTIKSIRINIITFPASRILNLAYSFPLLQSLSVLGDDGLIIDGDEPGVQPTVVRTPSPPVFTGHLEILLETGLGSIISRLLSLQGDFHFRELDVAWNDEDDILSTNALIERCSSTLESFSIDCTMSDDLGSVDLSKATKLKTMFICSLSPKFITIALQTVGANHRDLQRLSLEILHFPSHPGLDHGNPVDIKERIEESVYAEWMEFDRLLVQLHKSHLFRPKVLYTIPASMDEETAEALMVGLLPEATKGKAIDLTGMMDGSSIGEPRG